MWRAHGEVAYTTCGDSSGGEAVVFDCAYTNHLFPVEGYRYRGRPVGAFDRRRWQELHVRVCS